MTLLLPDLALARAVVDRDSGRRADAGWLTRVLRLRDGRAAVVGDPPRLDLDSRPGVSEQHRYLLGTHDGVAYFAAVEEGPDSGDEHAPRFLGLRDVGARLNALDAGLVVHGVSLANWHATHQHCPRCGAPTTVENAGHTRRCVVDGSEHYPRTDPAVIMLVVDDDDRLLLGRQTSWPEGRFSTLAGFVEPGESLEAAVRREVFEEAGVEVGDDRSAFLVQRGDETVGVVLVRDAGGGVAQVELDYVTPRFRDFTPGEFVYRRSGLFRDRGFRRVLSPPGMVAPYYEGLGFHRDGDAWALDLEPA